VLTCISKSWSASSAFVRRLHISRGRGRWVIFTGWNQTTTRFCVRRRHRTRRWKQSYQDSTVCHRAIMVVHLLPVRPSTTGRTHNSVNISTTVRVPTTYSRTAKPTRWRYLNFWSFEIKEWKNSCVSYNCLFATGISAAFERSADLVIHLPNWFHGLENFVRIPYIKRILFVVLRHN